MSLKKIEAYFCGWGENWHLGTLAHSGNTLLFEYSEFALQRGIELSPFYLRLGAQAYGNFPRYQEQLPGLISDSLPDGWGRRLMDQCFIKAGRSLANISPLDRLAFIHDRAMGALVFAPPDTLSDDPVYLDLVSLARSAQVVLAGRDTDALRELALTGGSPHGARPKVLVQYDIPNNSVSTDVNAAGTPWLVKFQAQDEAKEVCAIEVAYSELAHSCLMEMPATQYFDLTPDLAGFGIERFDRTDGMRVPILTLAGLLDDNFRVPSQDYATLLKATRALTKDEREVRKAFERCVFNVIFHNRDDHTKNFSFAMNRSMEWKLSPCYDLTYNTGFNWEHQMTVHGEGRNPSKRDLLALAAECDVPEPWARATIERFAEVAGTFYHVARTLPISVSTLSTIKASIEDNRKRML